MAEKQRSSLSIAWKITWSFMGKLALVMILIDLLLAAAACGIFFYVQERAALGDAWHWNIERGL